MVKSWQWPTLLRKIMTGLREKENCLLLCEPSSGCSALWLSTGQVSQCPPDDRVKLLPFSPHAELNSRAGWESEVCANPPRLARLGHLTLLPFLARKSLLLRLSSVLIIHFCFGSGEIFIDSDPEHCTASSGGVVVANTQCCTSSPIPSLAIFPSFPIANFLSLKYFTYLKFVPLRFVELGELTDWSCNEDTDPSELPSCGCLLPNHSCQNPYSIPHSPVGAE